MSNGRTDRRGRPVMSESKTGIARASDLEGEQSMRPRRPIQANPKSLPGAGFWVYVKARAPAKLSINQRKAKAFPLSRYVALFLSGPQEIFIC